MEPLFILNYETGEIEPWLGESLTANDTLDVWTLKLRDGVKWSDGEAFNADDVVFSIQLLIDNAPNLNDSACHEGVGRQRREGRRPDGRVPVDQAQPALPA